MSIRPGTFRAKVTNYGVSVSEKSGDPSIFIEFSWRDGDTECRWNWTGAYTTDKSIARIHATLLTLGMKTDDLDSLAGGVASGSLDTDSEFEIVVREDIYNDKPRIQIAFVNRPGENKFVKAMSQTQAKSIFASKNAKAAMAAARAEAGVPKPAGTLPRKGNSDDISNIPF